VVASLLAGLDPTQVRSVTSAGLSSALRAELRTDMAGMVLEAGPEAGGDQQPDSPADVIVMLPDTLQLPEAACVDDGVNCLEPPALLRLDAYASLSLFIDALTNALLADSPSANYSSISPLSAVANVSVPTHLWPGDQLTCASGSSTCLLTLHLPLLAAALAGDGGGGAACVELLQLGGLVASAQVAYPADVTTTSTGAAFASCKVPKVGTFVAVRYALAPQLGVPEVLVISTETTTSSTPKPQTPTPQAGGGPEEQLAAGPASSLNPGQTAAVVIVSIVSVALLVGGLVMASRAGLVPPLWQRASTARRARHPTNDFDDAFRVSANSGSLGGQSGSSLAPPPHAVLAAGPAGLAGAEEYGVPRQTKSPEPPEPAWPAAAGPAASGGSTLPTSTRSSQPATPRDGGAVVEAAAFAEAAAGGRVSGDGAAGEGVSYGRLRAAANLDDIPLEMN
jgi:hypothetical protein